MAKRGYSPEKYPAQLGSAVPKAARIGPEAKAVDRAFRKREIRARQKLNRALGAGPRFSGGQAG